MTMSKADLRAMSGMSEGSSGDLTKKQKGAVIHKRWVDAGFTSINDFSNRSPFDRKTLVKIEAGTAEDTTYERVMAWLDKFVGEPNGGRVVTFEVEGIYGVGRVSVAGPVEDAAELEERFARILDRLLAGQRDKSGDGGIPS